MACPTGEAPTPIKKSLLHRFTFPEQETKLRAGKECWRTDTASGLGEMLLALLIFGFMLGGMSELERGANGNASDRNALAARLLHGEYKIDPGHASA